MKKNISKILSGILLKTFLISSMFSFIAYQIINSKHTDSLEGKQGDFIEVMAGIFWTLILTVSSLPIYFNRIKNIRERPIFCFLSFFFVPVIVAFIFFKTGSDNSEWLTFYVTTSIFLLTLCFFYILFIRKASNVSGNMQHP